MRTVLKNLIHGLLAWAGFRTGQVRAAFWGPYRGLRFHLTPPMQDRLRVFYAGYEPEVQAWLGAYVQAGMTVFVVGAHAGIHVLFIARLLNGQGRVYAFEGWPENHDALLANISANPALQPLIEPVAACIAAQSGMIVMAQGESDGKHHIATAADSDQPQLTVPAITLDEFIARSGVRPDLILMDIEGHEVAALQGSTQLIAAYKPTLLLEFHENRQALEEWLAANQYTVDSLGRRHIVAR